jgi:hypothetical protein
VLRRPNFVDLSPSQGSGHDLILNPKPGPVAYFVKSTRVPHAKKTHEMPNPLGLKLLTVVLDDLVVTGGIL